MSSTHPLPRGERRLVVAACAVAALLTVAVGVAGTWLVVAGRGHEGASSVAARAGRVTRVTDVVDGDTIEVALGRHTEKVRLIGIDTPETKDPRRPVQCFGAEAAARTAELLPPGTEVRLEADVERRDAYDRVLAYVYRASDGLFVNAALATGGYADVLTYPPNVAHAEELRTAVAEARRERRGLWQACGEPGTPAP